MTRSVSRHFCFVWNMARSKLSVFVDESGNFQYPDSLSRFYILSLVLHDQSHNISLALAQLARSVADLGFDPENFVFHAGPIIRKEDGYSLLSRHWRNRVFDRMMTFARNVDFSYRCICVDKRFVTSSEQIVERLRNGLVEFIGAQTGLITQFDKVKIYYDCGQSAVTNLLHEAFCSANLPCVEFAQNVKPSQYKLFQVADLVCTVNLLEQKIAHGDTLTLSEERFFGGERAFKRNILRKLKRKEIP